MKKSNAKILQVFGVEYVLAYAAVMKTINTKKTLTLVATWK